MEAMSSNCCRCTFSGQSRSISNADYVDQFLLMIFCMHMYALPLIFFLYHVRIMSFEAIRRDFITYIAGFLSGVNFFFGGREPTHLFIRMYIQTHSTARHDTCVFNDIISYAHACSMHIRFSFRIMIKMGQWQIIVMYLTRGRYTCGIIVVYARGSGGMVPQENV